MKQLLTTLAHHLEKGSDLVLVTIIANTGGTPRSAGAHMIVAAQGAVFGTIGGGAVEHEAQCHAMRLLAHQQSELLHFDLSNRDASTLGMACGGKVAVFFQRISPNDQDFLDFLKKSLTYFAQTTPYWLVLTISEQSEWTMDIVNPNHWPEKLPCFLREENAILQKHPIQIRNNGVIYYSEPLLNASFVYVFGGGHIAQELVPLLARLDFHCIVYEDRDEFIGKELFPDAEKRILADFEEIERHITWTEDDYAVIITRGHSKDYIVEKQALQSNVRYIGVIGSLAKTRFVSQKLVADGFTLKDLQRVHAPIGLDIQAETPAEIAVSIAAQLIQTRAEDQPANHFYQK